MGRWAILLLFVSLCATADDSLYEHLKTVFSSDPSHASGSILADDAPPLHESIVSPYKDIDDYIAQTIVVNDAVPGRYIGVVDDSLYLQLVLLSSIGVLALMPESVTGWKEEELGAKSLETRWKENVSTRPVWDKDDWAINYIGHPVSGAWYYTMARNDGMTIAESAVFSALMSTFVWEYGYEAFAEVPSIQDLIVTPLAGSLLGEWFYALERKLDANGGVLLGSQAAGSVGYFFLDPLGRIAEGMKEVLRRVGVVSEVTMKFQTYPGNRGALRRTAQPDEPIHPVLGDYGFVIILQ